MVITDFQQAVMDYIRDNYHLPEQLPQSDEGLWFLINLILENDENTDSIQLLDIVFDQLNS